MNLRTAFYRARASILHPIQKALSSLPIPDPHHQYEGELLAAGAKPFGYILDRPMYGPDFVAILDKRDFNAIQQRAHADGAVAAGRLLKYEMRIPAEEAPYGNEHITHYYCQPQFLNDMMEVVRNHEDKMKGLRVAPLSREFGHYIGCTDTDFTYGEKNRLVQGILWHLGPLTRYCRAQTLKREAFTGTLTPLRTRP